MYSDKRISVAQSVKNSDSNTQRNH